MFYIADVLWWNIETMSAAEMRLNADLIRKTGFMPA